MKTGKPGDAVNDNYNNYCIDINGNGNIRQDGLLPFSFEILVSDLYAGCVQDASGHFTTTKKSDIMCLIGRMVLEKNKYPVILSENR